MSLSDVLLKAAIDMSGVKADVLKGAADAGDAGGKTMGSHFSTGLKVISGAAAIAFGAVARGALQMQNLGASYEAQTGANIAETQKWEQAVNAQAGSNVQSLDEVAAASTKVRQDLQLTGDAQTQATQQFLTFADATGQNAADAVDSFRGAIDAWHQDASAIPGLMDQLVASEQKYGGSIQDRLDVLTAAGPALQAMNMTQQQSIAFENLATAAGLNLTTIQRGLNSAVTKLPPGTSLVQFLTNLQAIQDPLARATLATSVFGTQAGPKLANAMAPGGLSLDQMATQLDDVSGTTQKAADAIDSTWGKQFQLLMNAASSDLRGLGMELGPAGSIMAGIGAMTPVWKGLGSTAKSVLSGILDLAKGAGSALFNAATGAGTALVEGETSAVAAGGPALAAAEATAAADVLPAAGEAGTAAGEAFVATETTAVTAGGAAVATGLWGAISAGLALLGPVALVVTLVSTNKDPGTAGSIVTNARANTQAIFAGQMNDNFIAIQQYLARVNRLADTARAQAAQRAQQAAGDLNGWSDEVSRAAVATGLAEQTAISHNATSMVMATMAAMKRTADAAGVSMSQITGDMQSMTGKAGGYWKTFEKDLTGTDPAKQLAKYQGELKKFMEVNPSTIKTPQALADWINGVNTLQGNISGLQLFMQNHASIIAGTLPDAMSQASGSMSQSVAAMMQQAQDLENTFNKTGTVSGSTVAKAYEAQLAAQKAASAQMVTAASTTGTAVGGALGQSLKDSSRVIWQDVPVDAPAPAYTSMIADGGTAGGKIGGSLADSLAAAYGRVVASARLLAGGVAANLQLHSPAKEGPWSQGGGPEVWGETFGVLHSRGLLRSARAGYDAARGYAGSVMAGLTLQPALSLAGGLGSFSVDQGATIEHKGTVNHVVHIDEASIRAARAAGATYGDIGELLAAAANASHLRRAS